MMIYGDQVYFRVLTARQSRFTLHRSLQKVQFKARHTPQRFVVSVRLKKIWIDGARGKSI